MEIPGKGSEAKCAGASGQLQKSVSYGRKEEIHVARLCQEGIMDKQACHVPTRPSKQGGQMQPACILSWQDGIRAKPGRLGISWRPENIQTTFLNRKTKEAEAVAMASTEGSSRRLRPKQSFIGRLEMGKHWLHRDQEVLEGVRRGRRRPAQGEHRSAARL